MWIIPWTIELHLDGLVSLASDQPRAGLVKLHLEDPGLRVERSRLHRCLRETGGELSLNLKTRQEASFHIVMKYVPGIAGSCSQSSNPRSTLSHYLLQKPSLRRRWQQDN